MTTDAICLSQYAELLIKERECLVLYGFSKLLKPSHYVPFRFYERDFGDGVRVLEHRQYVDQMWRHERQSVQLLVFQGTPFFCLRLFTNHVPNSSFRGMDELAWSAWVSKPENTQRLSDEDIPSSAVAIVKRVLKGGFLEDKDFKLYPPIPVRDHEEIWTYNNVNWNSPQASSQFPVYEQAEKFLYQRPMSPMVFDDKELDGIMAPLLPFSNINQEQMEHVRFAYERLVRCLYRCLAILGFKKKLGHTGRAPQKGLHAWFWGIEAGGDISNTFFLWGDAVQTKGFSQVIRMGKSAYGKESYWLVLDQGELEFRLIRPNAPYPEIDSQTSIGTLVDAIRNLLCVPEKTDPPLPEWDLFDVGTPYIEKRM